MLDRCHQIHVVLAIKFIHEILFQTAVMHKHSSLQLITGILFSKYMPKICIQFQVLKAIV